MQIIRSFGLSFIMTVICFLTSCSSRNKITIKGTVDVVDGNNKMIVYQVNDLERHVIAETLVGPDNTFSIELTSYVPGVVNVNCCGVMSVNVWLEDEDMVIHFSDKNQNSHSSYVHIQSGPKNELMNIMNYTRYLEEQKKASLSQTIYSKYDLSEDLKKLLFRDIYLSNAKANTDLYKFFIKKYSHLTSCLALLPKIEFKNDSLFIKEIINNIEQANPNDTLARKYLAKIRQTEEKRKRMEVGQIPPEISALDKDGNTISLKDFKGKVIVLDFWASWCAPCKKEMPKLKELYKYYKNCPNIAFISISIDKDKEEWLKAIQEEDLRWLQLCVPDGGKTVMDKYQFSGIPFILVIGKDGRICGKHLHGNDVQKIIMEALK